MAPRFLDTIPIFSPDQRQIIQSHMQLNFSQHLEYIQFSFFRCIFLIGILQMEYLGFPRGPSSSSLPLMHSSSAFNFSLGGYKVQELCWSTKKFDSITFRFVTFNWNVKTPEWWLYVLNVWTIGRNDFNNWMNKIWQRGFKINLILRHILKKAFTFFELSSAFFALKFDLS